jgi:hypothetical protein
MLIAGRRTGPTLLPMLLLLAGFGVGACSNRPLPVSSAVGGRGGAAGGSAGAPGQPGGGAGSSLAGMGGELVAGSGQGGDGGDATGGTVGAGGGAGGLATGGSARLPDGGTSSGGVGVNDCTGRTRGTVCAAGTCADGVVRGRYTCDGRGNCNPAEDVVCAPFACDTKTGGCLLACVNDVDCTNGKPCLNGSCGPKPLGVTCVSSAECASGVCADGVCCATTCTGACLSCAIPAHLGTCSPTAAGDPDPRGMCAVTNPASCGRNGTCDGVGGCANYPAGTACGNSSCREANDVMYASTARCNGVGTCVRTTNSCAPYACAAELGECRTSCTTEQDCVAGRACVHGSCGLVEQACTTDGECQSGFCAQGVCCQSRCDGACQSCALPGSTGICMPVPTPDGGVSCTTGP